MVDKRQGRNSKPNQQPEAPDNPRRINPKWFLVLVLVAVAGAAGINYLIEQSLYGSGPFVRFPFRGRSQLSAIQFNLPKGWRVKYNGHHPLSQGSIVDHQGEPRIEICWFQGSSQPDLTAEFVTSRNLPVGEAKSYRRAKTTNSSPFSSFPFATSGEVEIVDLEFLFDQGELMFTVRAEEEAVLTEVVWQCMETVQYEGE
ncbi:MAG: hypothetical protein IT365_29260 [Candidatus Hydrogenedentes bacterium]|nr:hypothetical protein [Candidatus Hydrogenedentota bacterium]